MRARPSSHDGAKVEVLGDFCSFSHGATLRRAGMGCWQEFGQGKDLAQSPAKLLIRRAICACACCRSSRYVAIMKESVATSPCAPPRPFPLPFCTCKKMMEQVAKQAIAHAAPHGAHPAARLHEQLPAPPPFLENRAATRVARAAGHAARVAARPPAAALSAPQPRLPPGRSGLQPPARARPAGRAHEAAPRRGAMARAGSASVRVPAPPHPPAPVPAVSPQ